MSGPILALYAAPAWRGADALEFLRVIAALVACDRDVRLLETGSVLAARRDLPDEAERILEHLEALGVRPTAPGEAGLVEAASLSSAVLRLGDEARSGSPPLAEAATLPALLEAGQVIRVPK